MHTHTHARHCLIGCDGIHSWTRKHVMRDTQPLRYLGYIVVLGIFDNAAFPLTQRRAFQAIMCHTL